jgi:ubiquinone/menaquinone biosynthesis C-methylase UbiE
VAIVNSKGGRQAPPVYRRYLSDRPQRYEAYLRAAEEYVGALAEGEFLSLYQKPFDRNPGNPTYYAKLYAVLNVLQAMEIRPGGRVLEVGSGPGWVTEILLGLGFEVDAVEPSASMIRVARERVAACVQHHHIANAPRVEFHYCSLEECALPDESVDAVLFYESLHHVIDEDRGLAQCFRVLRPGGVLGVGGESAWQPGNREQEDAWDEEMARFGTLENPFTAKYLDALLHKHGFREVVRCHGINGFFPVEMGNMTVKQAAQSPAELLSNLVARKPSSHFRTTADPNTPTRAEVTVLGVRNDPAAGKVCLRVRLVNRGESIWLPGPMGMGWVTVALYRGELGGAGFQEATPRCRLPRRVAPGDEVVLEPCYLMPEGYQEHPWRLDLVSEWYFWFSTRGSPPAEVRFPAGAK